MKDNENPNTTTPKPKKPLSKMSLLFANDEELQAEFVDKLSEEEDEDEENSKNNIIPNINNRLNFIGNKTTDNNLENSEQLLSEEENQKEAEQQHRSLKDRIFGKIEPGSIRGGIFSLSSTAIGAGALSLPKMMGQSSLVIGIFCLLFVGICSIISLQWLILSTKKHKIYDYSKLVNKVLGRKAAISLDAIIMVYLFGALISFHVIIYKLIGAVFYEFSNYKKTKDIYYFLDEGFWTTDYMKYALILGVACILLFPLSLMKDITKFRFTSMFGVLSLNIRSNSFNNSDSLVYNPQL